MLTTFWTKPGQIVYIMLWSISRPSQYMITGLSCTSYLVVHHRIRKEYHGHFCTNNVLHAERRGSKLGEINLWGCWWCTTLIIRFFYNHYIADISCISVVTSIYSDECHQGPYQSRTSCTRKRSSYVHSTLFDSMVFTVLLVATVSSVAMVTVLTCSSKLSMAGCFCMKIQVHENARSI